MMHIFPRVLQLLSRSFEHLLQAGPPHLFFV